jgi:hypothetical protein
MIFLQTGPIQRISLDVPQIIHEASKSPLGIFALMLLVLAGLAYIFFKGKKPAVTIPIFAAMLIGVVSYGFALTRTSHVHSYRISGDVVDSKTKDPIESAAVKLEWGGLAYPDDSDSDGRYTFTVKQTDDAIPSRIRLVAEAEGYKTYTHTIDDPLQNIPVTLLMRKAPSTQEVTQSNNVSDSLQPLNCEQLPTPTLKSLEGDTKTQIIFKNFKAYPVQVFWVDHSAHEQFWFEMPPQASDLVDTYLNHPWVVRSLEGKCLDIFISKVTTPSEAVIN